MEIITIDITNVRHDTLNFRRQAWYGCIIISRMIAGCAMGIPITARSNYQTRYTMEIHHQLRHDRTCTLVVLPVHNISIHTAQCMFATLCELTLYHAD